MSASKQKGTAFETSLLPAFRTVFPDADRMPLQGASDKGDLRLAKWIALEAKNCARLDLAGWVAEVEAERVNLGALVGAVVHKRKGKTDPFEQYATMKVRDLLVLLSLVVVP